jgi:DNA modification methylase
MFENTGNKSIDIWQRYADPIWMDIRRNRTIQFKSAKSEDDGRHVCPSQLDAIERSMDMFSNEGDTVLDPFNGVGSTGDCALRMNRKYIGFELKDSYFKQAVANLRGCERVEKQAELQLDWGN